MTKELKPCLCRIKIEPKWPAKRKETEPYNQYANIQWNKAIDACIKAWKDVEAINQG